MSKTKAPVGSPLLFDKQGLVVSTDWLRFFTAVSDIVVIKTTTGDLTDVFEGKFCINTFDNNFKVYADGAWRQIVTW